ncbi:MAG: hypothetical protein JWM20_14 [Patescibacteria group bacterium]|nr:hypothetical protein [Patescibacteria group bacterium]
MYTSSFSTTINAPLEKVWEAWTKPEQLKEFFFGTEMETTWQVGDPIYFRGAWEGKTYEDKGKILSYMPMKELSYTYWSSMSGTPDLPENQMTIKMSFEEVLEGTKLTVEQDAKTQEAADHSTENWKMVVGELEKFLAKQ